MMKRNKLIAIRLFIALLVSAPVADRAAAQGVNSQPAADYQQAFEFVARQLAKMSELTGKGYAYHTVNGKWKTDGPDGWTSGFMPGMMWKVYARTKDPRWLERGRRWTEPIGAHRHSESDLDFGFLFMPTFVAGHRLTGDEAYRQIALDAAAAFAKRYVHEGRYLRSWGRVDDPQEQGFIIIDFLMNLNLMFWASREERNPLLFEMAYNTALVTMKTAVRDDGSSLQVIELDPKTGEKRFDRHKQAYSVTSCWARGQAFGIYGLTETYQNTKDPRFLKTAMKMADYYIARAPADHVPYWDFLAPNIPDEPRDSSAAAITAAGLLQLAQAVTDPAKKKRYREMAVKIVDSLTRNYLATGEAIEQGRILLHGTIHKPAGVGIDESTIIGDHYYLEALLKIIEEQGNVSSDAKR